ncbi:unnamed protein product [Lathyrus sativus]|nr:unnamed protein product [Lathyrus sativus]
MFAMTQYWLTCFPFPKTVLQRIESICRIFLWIGGFEGSRKAPVAWKQICSPRSHGGLNVVDLEVWNKATILKLLWNVSEKEDSLWVKWVQTYAQSQGGLSKHERSGRIQDRGVFRMSNLYAKLHDCGQPVEWRNLVYGNNARPRANFMLWLACHGRLATKDRLHNVWTKILRWAQINHTPGNWHSKLKWLIQHTKGKGVRVAVIKMAISKTIYEIWQARNKSIFGKKPEITIIGRKVIDTLVYKG